MSFCHSYACSFVLARTLCCMWCSICCACIPVEVKEAAHAVQHAVLNALQTSCNGLPAFLQQLLDKQQQMQAIFGQQVPAQTGQEAQQMLCAPLGGVRFYAILPPNPMLFLFEAVRCMLRVSLSPQVLLLAVNRYSFCLDHGRANKLHHALSYPMTLKLRPQWTSDDCQDRRSTQYQLIGLVTHHGQKATGGRGQRQQP